MNTSARPITSVSIRGTLKPMIWNGALPGWGGIPLRTEHAAECLLQEERHADGAGDQRRQSHHTAERSIRDALGQHCDSGGCDDRNQQDRAHAQDRMRSPGTERLQRISDEITGERASHHDVAVREVDQPQHAVDHCVAQRDLGVDAADGQPEPPTKSNHCAAVYRLVISVLAIVPTTTTATTPIRRAHRTISSRIETGHGRTPWPDRSQCWPQTSITCQIFFGFLPIPRSFGSSDVELQHRRLELARHSPYWSQAIGPLMPSNLMLNTGVAERLLADKEVAVLGRVLPTFS